MGNYDYTKIAVIIVPMENYLFLERGKSLVSKNM